MQENGANVNASDKNKYTALLSAAGNGHLEIVKLLEASGADINAKNKFENTPLIWAALNGHLPVVKYLQAKGSNVTEKNREIHKFQDVDRGD